MDDKTREREFINSLEIYQSLLESMDEAGGAGLAIDDMQEMTVSRLLSVLAPNSIRFVYAPPKKKKTETTKKKETKKKETIVLTRKEATALVLFLEAYIEEMGEFEDECLDLEAFASLDDIYKALCDFVHEEGER